MSEVLGGRYRIVRLLGRGGMAEVFEAVHVGLDERVAVKRLFGDALATPTTVERFFREAQAAARLKTEHAVRVLDVGFGEDKHPYMVMELLEGIDLADAAAQGIPADLAVDYIIQAADALAEAHSLGIVHRDVKPANLFIANQPDGTQRIKVLDFGISKATLGTAHLTATDFTFGTPMYMSPEQMRSAKDADHRSDIWSLGVVLYELLEGTLPFVGDTYAELVLRVALEEANPMQQPIAPGLVRVVERCLVKQPAARFQTTSELMEALVPYARDTRMAWTCAERSARLARRTASQPRMRVSESPIAKAATAAAPTPPPAPPSQAEGAVSKLREAKKRVALKPLTRPGDKPDGSDDGEGS